MSFGESVKQARIKRKWLQADLGKRVGVTQTFISQIESGTMPKADLTCYLIEVLELDLDAICTELKHSYMNSKGIVKPTPDSSTGEGRDATIV